MASIDTLRMNRSSLLVFFSLLKANGSATYEGMQVALGLESLRGAKRAVASAVTDGVARVVQTGGGQGAKAVIKLTPQAEAYARRLFHGK